MTDEPEVWPGPAPGDEPNAFVWVDDIGEYGGVIGGADVQVGRWGEHDDSGIDNTDLGLYGNMTIKPDSVNSVKSYGYRYNWDGTTDVLRDGQWVRWRPPWRQRIVGWFRPTHRPSCPMCWGSHGCRLREAHVKWRRCRCSCGEKSWSGKTKPYWDFSLDPDDR